MPLKRKPDPHSSFLLFHLAKQGYLHSPERKGNPSPSFLPFQLAKRGYRLRLYIEAGLLSIEPKPGEQFKRKCGLATNLSEPNSLEKSRFHLFSPSPAALARP